MHTTSVGMLDLLRKPGDSFTWEEFAQLYQPLLYSWLQRSGLRRQDAEDVAQEVLVVVARELPKFRHNQHRGAFRRWLRNILVNRLREFRRSRRSAVAVNSTLLDRLATQLADSQCGTTRLFDLEHDLHVIHRTLDRIKPEFRPQTWTAFQRLMLDNADPETVARELGISVGALYTAKSRVLKRLRQEVGAFLS